MKVALRRGQKRLYKPKRQSHPEQLALRNHEKATGEAKTHRTNPINPLSTLQSNKEGGRRDNG